MIGEISALSSAVLWGITSILYKKGLTRFRLLPALIIRTFWGMVFFLLLYLGLRGLDFYIYPAAVIYLVLGGVLRLVLGDIAYFRGLELASISRVVPLTFTFPLFTIILSAELLKEGVSMKVVSGTLLIILGIWILSRVDHMREKNLKMGVFFSLLAALLYAISILLTKIGLRYMDPFLATLIRIPIPLLILLLGFSLKENPKKIVHSPKSHAIFGLAGITGLGIGSYLFLYSLTMINTAQATSLSSTTPLFSSLFALIFLKENITTKILIGILTTFIGVIIILL